MVFKKKITKKIYKKKNYKKKAKKFVLNRSLVNVGQGFPKKMLMTHKYVETVSHTSTTGVASFYKFICNGMFDPNYNSTGHQPYYFDQMSAIYNHYTVIGSKISIKVIPAATATVPFKIVLSQNDDVVQVNTSIDGMAEQSTSTALRIFPSGSNDLIRTMVNKWSAKKTFGGSVLANDNLQGSSTANPSEITVWSIGLQALDGSSTVSTYLDVEITYIAVWDEIKDIAQS